MSVIQDCISKSSFYCCRLEDIRYFEVKKKWLLVQLTYLSEAVQCLVEFKEERKEEEMEEANDKSTTEIGTCSIEAV